MTPSLRITQTLTRYHTTRIDQTISIEINIRITVCSVSAAAPNCAAAVAVRSLEN